MDLPCSWLWSVHSSVHWRQVDIRQPSRPSDSNRSLAGVCAATTDRWTSSNRLTIATLSSLVDHLLGLYRIYFFPIRPEPDFQIDCNFTNLMCKNITNVRVIWVFDHFLCSSYCYIIYMHSRSNLCHSNVSSTYYISKKYLNNLTFNIPKIDFSNSAKTGSGGIFAGDGFLPDLEKVPDSGRSRSRSQNAVQPYFTAFMSTRYRVLFLSHAVILAMCLCRCVCMRVWLFVF